MAEIGMINTAKKYRAAGLSPIPIRADGSKAPTCAWEKFQHDPPTLKELSTLFTNGVGIGVVCGQVSGGLEVLDFERGAPIKEWWKLVKDELSPASDIPVVKTPGRGWHLYYRCSTVEGNQKLARKANGDVLIETRGEGGYVLTVGSPAACHEKGEYKLVKGDLLKIPTITPEQRQHLLLAAKSFDLTPKEESQIIRGPKEHGRPGDDFNAQASWKDILNPHGWEVAYERNGTTHWRRPGKDKKKGISATTGHGGGDLFYNFSSNGGPFESDRSYSKFAAWTVLNHGGDFSAAARELAKEGYGEQTLNGSVKRSDRSDRSVRPDSETSGRREVVCLSDVTPEKVEFLTYPYIPLGKLTLLDGDPGVGKSNLSLAIAAGVTLGKGIPGMVKAEPGNVLVLSCEDGLADTIRPRLDALGADASKVFALRGVMTLDGDGLEELRGYLEKYKPRLVIIDPLFGYMGGKVDIHKGNEVRQVTAGLAELAEEFNCAIIAIRHLTKSGRDKAIYRGVGSIDFTAAARSVLLAGTDPDGQRALIHIKHNLSPEGDPIGFSIEDGQFTWTGKTTVTKEDILAVESDQSSTEETEEFLRNLLADGPVPSLEVLKRGTRELGCHNKTLYRAKKKLDIKSRRVEFKGGMWCWCLPEDGHCPEAPNGEKHGQNTPIKADSVHLRSKQQYKSNNNNNLVVDGQGSNSSVHLRGMSTFEDGQFSSPREGVHLADEEGSWEDV